VTFFEVLEDRGSWTLPFDVFDVPTI